MSRTSRPRGHHAWVQSSTRRLPARWGVESRPTSGSAHTNPQPCTHSCRRKTSSSGRVLQVRRCRRRRRGDLHAHRRGHRPGEDAHGCSGAIVDRQRDVRVGIPPGKCSRDRAELRAHVLSAVASEPTTSSIHRRLGHRDAATRGATDRAAWRCDVGRRRLPAVPSRVRTPSPAGLLRPRRSVSVGRPVPGSPRHAWMSASHWPTACAQSSGASTGSRWPTSSMGRGSSSAVGRAA